MAKLNEIVKKEPLFEGSVQTSKEDKETLAAKEQEITVYGFAKLSSPDGDYGVCKYDDGNGIKTMTINTIQLESLTKALAVIGINQESSNDTEIYFKEELTTVFKKVDAKTSNKSYYVFE